MQTTAGRAVVNANGARFSGPFELHNGVLTVTYAGESLSVAMPEHCLLIPSAARVLLRTLVARRSSSLQSH